MIDELDLDTLPQIIPIGEAFAKEANYPGGWSWPDFARMWVSLLNGGLGKIFVSTDGGQLGGALGAVFTPDPYSGQMTAVEQFWYVLPEHRKTRAGMELFQAFQVEAKKRQARKIVMVHLASLTPESLQKFYEKEGFRLAEQTFWKIL
jgi:GNAT superfamily N-acetyltransferase